MHSHLSLSFSYILYDRRRARKRITRHLAASPMRFVASLVVLLSPCCVCFPAVTWRVSKTQRLPVSPDVAQWLANSDEALPCVIEASESILSVEKLDDELYRGRVAQSKFPLVRIEPSMTFRVAREPNGRIPKFIKLKTMFTVCTKVVVYINQTGDEPQKQDTQANKRSPLLSEEVPYQITLINTFQDEDLIDTAGAAVQHCPA